ncbi:MAG: hypothetical protein Q7R41_08260 [Phycisphaerales bacterium]|nr:hypothetical protein [Phycisphaerales bacterium]
MDFESLRFIRHFEIINCDNENDLVEDESRMQECESAGLQCQLTRGRILTYAVETERLIEGICGLYFAPQDPRLRDRLQDIVLASDSCSFSAKVRILYDIAGVLEITPLPAKAVFDDLMSIRNKFAHGKIVVDWIAKQAFIRHSKKDLDAIKLAEKFCERYLTARTELVKLAALVREQCQAVEDEAQ